MRSIVALLALALAAPTTVHAIALPLLAEPELDPQQTSGGGDDLNVAGPQGTPSTDPNDPARLIGGEVQVWQFDDGDFDTNFVGSIIDRSTTGDTTYRQGGTPVVAGPNGFGGAMFLNGGSYLHGQTHNGLTAINDDFTMMLWIRPYTLAYTQAIQWTRIAGSAFFISTYYHSSGMSLVMRDPVGAEANYGFGYPLPLNEWTHIAFVQKGVNLTLYVNGDLHTNIIKTPGVYNAGSVVQSYVGAPDCCGISWMYGTMDELRWYKRGLTQAEVRSIKDFPYVHLNDAPVLTPIGNRHVAEEATLTFSLSATDAENDPLTFSANALPEGASFDETTATFSWTPTLAQSGTHAATFVVNDGLLSDAETIAITVGNTNQPPVLSLPEPISVAEGETATFLASGSDPDGDALAFSLVSGPAGATVSASGAFSWMTGSFDAGQHEVVVQVSDGALTDVESIVVTVANVNQLPTAHAGSDITTPCTGPSTIVALNGSASTDPDGTALGYMWSLLGLGSLATPNAATTQANFPAGMHVARLEVNDGEATATDDVYVRIVDADAPSVTDLFPAAPGVYSGAEHVPAGDEVVIVGSVDVRAGASDACSTIARVVFEVDDGTRVEDTAAPYGFTYAPLGIGIQYRTLTVTAYDAFGNSASESVAVTVATVAPQS